MSHLTSTRFNQAAESFGSALRLKQFENGVIEQAAPKFSNNAFDLTNDVTNDLAVNMDVKPQPFSLS